MRQHAPLLIVAALSLGFAPAPQLPDPVRDPERYLLALLKKNGEITLQRLRWVIRAEKVRGGKLLGVVARRADQGETVVVRAREAGLRVERWRGKMVLRLRQVERTSDRDGSQAIMLEWFLELPLPADLGKE
jgi:hypothetical protein